MYVIGLDIGGTKIEGAIVDDNANILCKKRIPTLRDKNNYHDIIFNIAKLCKELCLEAKISIDQLKGIGAGLPGTVSPVTRRMLSGNTNHFADKDFSGDLKKLLNLNKSVCVANDANCFALAEWRFGAGKTHALKTGKNQDQLTGIGIILGTGVGGGVIFNGKMIEGRSGSASEFGHTSLYPDGPLCYCDRHGCVELYLSGKALEDRYLKKTGHKKASSEIFHDLKDIEWVNEYKKNLIIFLTNLQNVFDPDYFVLGGGVSNQDIIYEGLQEEVWKQAFIKTSRPAIYKNEKGDSAGVIGAALLV